MKKTASPQEANQRAWIIASVIVLIVGVAVTAAIFAFSPGAPESKATEGSGSADRAAASRPAQPSTGASGGGKPSESSPAKPASTASSTAAAPSVTADLNKSLEAFRGKVVIVDLWTTWCPPCRRGIPDFIALQDEYRDKGLEVIGVSLDPVDSRGGGGAAAVQPFMQQFGINYTIWMVNDFKALGSYQLGQGYPTTYIIDRQGRTVKQYVGLRPKEVFENDIKQLL
jgi:cytochrome c biogenesis protein CcmG/thiol:disulfide interchange protein DsbE